jgi:polygalacturonase
VSIQTGCSNVYIHNVNCGPGHGISIGGLGKANTKACVSNVTVRDVTMTNTLTGVRIKTWQVKTPSFFLSHFDPREGKR